MSNYQYKGVPITEIIDTTTDPQTTNFANVYQGLPPITPPQYNINNSNLLTNLEYKYDGTDLSTVCAARHWVYYNSQNISPPYSNINQFRYIIIGGSGGGGGGGGCANNSGIQGNGGNGGSGSSGNIAQGTTNISYGSSLSITIGNGGNGGGGGRAASNNSSGYTTKAGGGGSGGTGNASQIINNQNGDTIVANGGAGGGGGGGGWAYYTNSIFAKNNSVNGASANNGNVFNSGSTNWDSWIVKNQSGGNGGAGGNNQSSNGSQGGNGSPGFAVIVWLYD